MRNLSDDVIALEIQIQIRAEAAKRAIRAYNKLILGGPVSSAAAQKTNGQREVAHAVGQYMEVRRKLDELRANTPTDSAI